MLYEQALASAQWIRRKTDISPSVALILGSGLSDLAQAVEDQVVIPYGDIPNFPVSTVEGHAGNLVLGRLEGQWVAMLQGRFHFYEGFTMAQIVYPLYVLHLLGVRSLVVTNACGGINPGFAPGDLMLITDHINLLGVSPLFGPNDSRFGPRFPDMTHAYSPRLLEKARSAAQALDIPSKEGVYALFPGPTYETAAEIRAYAVLGADAIGMSTVPEVIAANHLGMEVLGIACITNMATGIAKTPHSHQEVIRMAQKSSTQLSRWIRRLMAQWEV